MFRHVSAPAANSASVSGSNLTWVSSSRSWRCSRSAWPACWCGRYSRPARAPRRCKTSRARSRKARPRTCAVSSRPSACSWSSSSSCSCCCLPIPAGCAGAGRSSSWSAPVSRRSPGSRGCRCASAATSGWRPRRGRVVSGRRCGSRSAPAAWPGCSPWAWACSAPRSWCSFTRATRRKCWRDSGSARRCWRCSCVSAAASTPRPPTWARTWWARSSRASRRTTRGTPRRSRTTLVTTWATARAWRRTCSSPTRSCWWPR